MGFGCGWCAVAAAAANSSTYQSDKPPSPRILFLSIAAMSKTIRQFRSLVSRAHHRPPPFRRPFQCRCYVSATKPTRAAAIPLNVSSDQAPLVRPSKLDDAPIPFPAAPEGPAAGAWPTEPPTADANMHKLFCTKQLSRTMANGPSISTCRQLLPSTPEFWTPCSLS